MAEYSKQGKIFVPMAGNAFLPVKEALPSLTDEAIDMGFYTPRTIKDLAHCCRVLLEERDQLLTLGERCERALIQEGVRIKPATEFAAYRQTLQNHRPSEKDV